MAVRPVFLTVLLPHPAVADHVVESLDRFPAQLLKSLCGVCIAACHIACTALIIKVMAPSIAKFAGGNTEAMLRYMAVANDQFFLNLAMPAMKLAADAADGVKGSSVVTAIARNGVACDRAVDTQMPQNSIYVLGKSSGQYTDTDFELFGCSQGEAARVRSAFSLAKDEKLRAESLKKSLHLENVVKAARLSLEKVENCKVD